MAEQQKLPQSIWDACKEDYMNGNYKSIKELADKHGIIVSTLQDRINRKRKSEHIVPWKNEKDALTKEMMDVALQKSQNKYVQAFSTGADIISHALEDIHKDLKAGKFSGMEKVNIAKTAMECISKMQGIIRLESNQSTQNIAVHHSGAAATKNLEDTLNSLKDKGLIDCEIEDVTPES